MATKKESEQKAPDPTAVFDLNVKWVKLHESFALPVKGTPGAAGYDMVACLPDTVNPQTGFLIMPRQRALISLGCQVEVPEGWQMNILPRSGLASKQGLTILNTPGLIDSDYRGEVKALVVNTSDSQLSIKDGDRICQVTFSKVPSVKHELVTELSNTDRGAGGFGSTGVGSKQ